MLIADSATTAYLIALPGVAAIIGSVIALVKLGGDRDSAAVERAEGSVKTMGLVVDDLEGALARANARGDFYKAQYERAVAEKRELIQRWGPFPIDDEL